MFNAAYNYSGRKPAPARNFILILCGIFGCVLPLKSVAQNDSLWISLESSASFSTEAYLPHYFYSLSEGLLLSHDPNVIKPTGKWKHTLNKHWNFSGEMAASAEFPLEKSYLHEGYGAVQWKFLEAWGGRRAHVSGFIDDSLTSGSLSRSGNTVPIPMVMVETLEFVEVPFTQNWLYIKASFGHGWLGNDRYVKGTWLHEKSLYFKLKGKLPFSIYGGLQHFAQWGGISPKYGKIDNSFSDFMRVITASSGDQSTAGGENVNRLGNHLGVLEKGISFQWKGMDVRVYDQVPFEDHSGIKWLFGRDHLAGLDVTFKDKKIIRKVLYEFINTKYQSGAGIPDPIIGHSNYGYDYGGRDDYYNNYLYRSGWTYGGMVIGSPLITTLTQMQKYHPEFIDSLSGAIVNNRVSGHHLGILIQPSEKIKLMAKFTYTSNSGTYTALNGGRFSWGSKKNSFDHESYYFYKSKDQLYSMFKMQIILKKNYPLWLNLNLAKDLGALTNNWGVQIGLEFRPLICPAQKSTN